MAPDRSARFATRLARQASQDVLEEDNNDDLFEAVGDRSFASQLAGLGNKASQCFLNACVQAIRIPLRRLLEDERLRAPESPKCWFEQHNIFDVEGEQGAQELYMLCRQQEKETLAQHNDPRIFANMKFQQDTMECLRKMIAWAELENPKDLEAPGACIGLWQSTCRKSRHGGRGPSNVQFTNTYTMHVSDTDATTTFNVGEQSFVERYSILFSRDLSKRLRNSITW